MNELLTKTRPSTPKRWVEAAERGVREQIIVREQTATTWTATSRDGKREYVIVVQDNIPVTCSCPSGGKHDVCKHRAIYYLYTMQHRAPVFTTPLMARRCASCAGDGVIVDEHGRDFTCFTCDGTGLPLA